MFDEYQDGLRALAEERMDESSRVKVWRLTDRTTQDESTGLEVPVWEVTHDDLPCRIGGSRNAATSRTVNIGGVELQLALRIAHLPASTDNLHDGDLIDVTSGENEGAVFRIVEADFQDQATARRLPVIADVRPEEW
ncbi:hypothetical protein NOK12_16540 [Nocardioides sp. OK12]|uniref:DUF6093 family protein n=1 Tax=Nocardioides sp. OK12 TaxID=2758661 RepID=UPI0021C2A6B0|nr:DUF6093 family protein [Nocardioides sp. OK12]GHJ59136.1 hypothetical protein NOK12_16540 [Nocardioides sp. OK12]